MPEVIKGILRTLEAIEAGEAGELSGTYWRMKYKQDVEYLMRERQLQLKDLISLRDQVEKALTALKENEKKIDDIKRTIHEFQLE